MAEVDEHSNVTIQCRASGHPKPTISWRREDGLPIKLNGNHAMAIGKKSSDNNEMMDDDPTSNAIAEHANLISKSSEC